MLLYLVQSFLRATVSNQLLLDLVQPFLGAEVSLEFAEISIHQWFLRYSL